MQEVLQVFLTKMKYDLILLACIVYDRYLLKELCMFVTYILKQMYSICHLFVKETMYVCL